MTWQRVAKAMAFAKEAGDGKRACCCLRSFPLSDPGGG